MAGEEPTTDTSMPGGEQSAGGGGSPAPEMHSLQTIILADNFEDMLATIPDRKTLLGTGVEPLDAGELQRRMWERVYLAANRVFYRALFHMGCVSAFYYIKRIELQNLIRVAELLRQEKSSSQIVRELVRLPETHGTS